MPTVADGVPVRYVAADAPWAAAVGAVAGGTRLQPAAVARVHLRYDDDKAALLHDEEWEAVLTPLAALTDPSAAHAVDYDDRDLVPDAPAGARYVLTDAPIAKKTFWTQLQRDIIDHLVRNRRLDIQANKTLKLWSRPGESPEQFAERCRAAAEAGADQAAAALRAKYELKAKRLRDQLMTAEAKVHEYAAAAEPDTLLSTAGSLLGAFLGGRRAPAPWPASPNSGPPPARSWTPPRTSSPPCSRTRPTSRRSWPPRSPPSTRRGKRRPPMS